MTPETLDLIEKFAGPFATVIASVTAAGVTTYFGLSQARSAKRQLEIASDKIALDLFDKRFDVYERIRLPIGAITRSGASSSQVERDLLEAINAARFLFGPDATNYFDEIYHHLIKLDYCNQELSNPNLNANERGKLASDRTRHFEAITAFYENTDAVFGPYLSATHKFAEHNRT